MILFFIFDNITKILQKVKFIENLNKNVVLKCNEFATIITSFYTFAHLLINIKL